MKKKLISFMMAMAVALTSIPINSFADEIPEKTEEEIAKEEMDEQLHFSEENEQEKEEIQAAEDWTGRLAEFKYMLNPSKEGAYAVLGEKVTSKNLKFFDGIEMGITDKSNIYYNEIVTLDGVTSRKQYNANNVFLKMDESFYSDTDDEFLFSLMYYDFGPSEGKFYFEYNSINGSLKQVELVKPGIDPGWKVKTVAMDDLDVNTTYEDGSHFRIINGAYNAFAKVEVINVSRAKREKTNIDITCLGSDVVSEMESLKMIPAGDKRFLKDSLGKQANLYDANELNNFITKGESSGISTSNKSVKLTQGELLKIFFKTLGIEKQENESFVEAAERLEISQPRDFMLFDEAPATYYNLINLAHSVLIYEKKNGDILLADLIKKGVYEGVQTSTIKSDAFQFIYYREPRKLEPVTIINNLTGRKYYYINFFGTMLNRGYLTMNGWMPDGSGFICASPGGYIYLYDVETHILKYLDKTMATTDPKIWMSLNGWVYFLALDDGVRCIRRVHPVTLEKEHVYTPPKGLVINDFSLTNDGDYMSIAVSDPTFVLKRPKDTTPIVRINLKENKLEYKYYKFDFSNSLGHFQIHPTNPDFIIFCHDAANVPYEAIYDRVNVMNMSTGKVHSVFQGIAPNGNAIQLGTHEVWSLDGKYIYYCSWQSTKEVPFGEVPAVVRTDVDGTHRQYIKGEFPMGGVNHANISGDNRMLCTDEEWLSLISTETRQTFPIVPIRPIIASAGHPYHPHPQLSYSGNKVNWGHVHDGVLGIAWMDYTDILENEVAKGGRYEFGDDVKVISYEGIECESKITEKYGRECVITKPGNAIFFDINPEVIDTTNGAIKLTFDYYDNTTSPLTLTYTKGVEEPNDVIYSFNKTVDIPRSATDKWKTAEVIIDCGNFESIGRYESDFKINSTSLNAFISNVRIEVIEK